jgi:hypothetical protein
MVESTRHAMADRGSRAGFFVGIGHGTDRNADGRASRDTVRVPALDRRALLA